jgi:broad specificity phosphatase PhoE
MKRNYGIKIFLLISGLLFVSAIYLYFQYSGIKVYVIKHGKTQKNPPGISQSFDFSTLLSEDGLQQAKYLGDFLAKKGVKVIYTSPAEHDRTTAAIIAAKTRSVVVIDDGIQDYTDHIKKGDNIQTKGVSIVERVKKGVVDVYSKKGSQDDSAQVSQDMGVFAFLKAKATLGTKELYIVTHDDVLQVLYKKSGYSGLKDGFVFEPASITIFGYNIFTDTLSFVGIEKMGDMKSIAQVKKS